MRQILGRIIVGLLTVCAVIYVGDWVVWRTRLAMGSGMGTVDVNVMIVSPLKNGREQYDWDGQQTVDCSRSLFPHAGEGACWWLARKQTLEEN